MADRGLHWKLLLACLGGCFLLAASMLASLLEPSRVSAQSATADWEKAAGGKMSFEIASVKQDNSGQDALVHWNVPPANDDGFSPTGGLFSSMNVPLIQTIRFAFKLTSAQMEDLVAQVPSWVKLARYDIEARATGNPTKDQYRLMMQALLADRFKLAAHREVRESSVVALELVKPGTLGPNLRVYTENPSEPCTTAEPSANIQRPTVSGGFPAQCGTLTFTLGKTAGTVLLSARAVTAASMAEMIGWDYAGAKPIVDKTGLPKVDFIIELPTSRPEDDEATRSAARVEALREQLGLKFQAATEPAGFFIIDHIEEPSPN